MKDGASGTETFLRITRRTQAIPFWGRGLLTVLMVVVAMGARLLLGVSNNFPFILFLPTIVFCAAFFGGGFGIFAASLSGGLAAYFFIPWHGDSLVREVLAVVVFIAVGSAVASFIAMMHVLVMQLSAAHEEALGMNARLTSSEREKDVLLDELAHRTKNDLQTLNALLRMQARHVTEPSAKVALQAAADRTNVVARMHDRLQRRDRAAVVHLASFVNDICEDVRKTHFDMRPLAIRTDLAPMLVDARRAASLGLILNELLTNALKYAFPDDRPGTINVRLTGDARIIELTVCDDGVGMDGGSPRGTGLGQRLVRALAHELGGVYAVDSQPGAGTRCELKLPLTEGA